MRYLRAYATVLLATGLPRLTLAISLMIAGSLTEGVGVAVLVAALGVAGLDASRQGAVTGLTEVIHGAFARVGLPPGLFPLLLVFVVAAGARTLLTRLQMLAIFDVEQRFILALRTRLYRAIVEADWLELSRARSSDFSGALIEHSGRLGQATSQLLTLAADLVVSAVLIGLALSVSVPTTLLVLAAGALLFRVYAKSVHVLHQEGTAYAAAMNDLHAASTEQLQSMKLVKAFGAQERTIALFARTAETLTALDRAMAVRQGRIAAWFEIGSTLTLAAMLYVSAELVRLPPASVLTLLFVFFRLMPRFASGHQNIRIFAGCLPSFETVIDVIERCERAAEPGRPTAGPPRRLARDLRLEEVGFAYGRAEGATVSGIDLALPSGTVLALAGASGSGKSTVIDLASGLLVAQTGRLRVDGAVLTAADLRGWREAIGYVGADVPLLHMSLRANMLWACPDAEDREIAEVLGIAAVERLVGSWPDGLDTVLGDRGALLSQGERQRIGLARALLRRPALLILDEATNGLDAETEVRVMAAVRRARPELTILLVAHRLSTLHVADQIVVMEAGRIVERGTWHELSARPGSRFWSLNRAQRLGCG